MEYEPDAAVIIGLMLTKLAGEFLNHLRIDRSRRQESHGDWASTHNA